MQRVMMQNLRAKGNELNIHQQEILTFCFRLLAKDGRNARLIATGNFCRALKPKG